VSCNLSRAEPSRAEPRVITKMRSRETVLNLALWLGVDAPAPSSRPGMRSL
jgi:hypothetical protein